MQQILRREPRATSASPPRGLIYLYSHTKTTSKQILNFLIRLVLLSAEPRSRSSRPCRLAHRLLLWIKQDSHEYTPRVRLDLLHIIFYYPLQVTLMIFPPSRCSAMFSASAAPFDGGSEICAGFVSRRVRKHFQIIPGGGPPGNVTFKKLDHRYHFNPSYLSEELVNE